MAIVPERRTVCSYVHVPSVQFYVHAWTVRVRTEGIILSSYTTRATMIKENKKST